MKCKINLRYFMKRILYLFKRITSMDYKSFFDTINQLHKQSKISRIKLFFDIIHCGIKFGAGYNDYKWFRFYEIDDELRKTYINRTKNNQIVRQLNNPDYYHLVNDKIEFNKLFNDFLKRDWLNLKEASFSDFESFIDKHNPIIIKPIDLTGGYGVEKLNKDDFNSIKQMYDYIMDHKAYLIEECVIQHEKLNQLYPYAVNTYRIMTIRCENTVDVISAYIRIGNNGAVVDNHHSGGMASPVDIETGKILYPAIDIDCNLFEIHPMTNTKLVGFELPCWKQAIELVKKAALVIPELRYIGWDVAISVDGPLLIEGNHIPGYDIMQLPDQNPSRVGFLDMYRKYVKNI